MHSLTQPSFRPCISPSIRLSNHSAVHPPNQPTVHPSNTPTNTHIQTYIDPSIHIPSIRPPSVHSSIHLCIHTSIHFQSMCAFPATCSSLSLSGWLNASVKVSTHPFALTSTRAHTHSLSLYSHQVSHCQTYGHAYSHPSILWLCAYLCISLSLSTYTHTHTY